MGESGYYNNIYIKNKGMAYNERGEREEAGEVVRAVVTQFWVLGRGNTR